MPRHGRRRNRLLPWSNVIGIIPERVVGWWSKTVVEYVAGIYCCPPGHAHMPNDVSHDTVLYGVRVGTKHRVHHCSTGNTRPSRLRRRDAASAANECWARRHWYVATARQPRAAAARHHRERGQTGSWLQARRHNATWSQVRTACAHCSRIETKGRWHRLLPSRLLPSRRLLPTSARRGHAPTAMHCRNSERGCVFKWNIGVWYETVTSESCPRCESPDPRAPVVARNASCAANARNGSSARQPSRGRVDNVWHANVLEGPGWNLRVVARIRTHAACCNVRNARVDGWLLANSRDTTQRVQIGCR